MPAPKYTISIQSGYVLIEESPDFNLIRAELQPLLQAIEAACHKAQNRNVIIRGPKTKVKLSTMETLIFAREIAKLNLTIAITNQHDASKDFESLLEDVATNRGSPIRFFSSEEDAKDWLGV